MLGIGLARYPGSKCWSGNPHIPSCLSHSVGSSVPGVIRPIYVLQQ